MDGLNRAMGDLQEQTSLRLRDFRARTDAFVGLLWSDTDKVRLLAAIRELQSLTFDLSTLGWLKPHEYNEPLVRPLTSLGKLVRETTDPEVRKAAIVAMAHYSRNNLVSYSTPSLSRATAVRFEELYYDSKLPDNYRKFAFDEMRRAYGQLGFEEGPKEFKAGEELLRQRDAEAARRAHQRRERADREAKEYKNMAATLRQISDKSEAIARQMESATRASRQARPTAETLKNYASRSGFERALFTFTGMTPIPGAKGHQGLEAIVAYTPHGKSTMEIRGKIEEVYQGGFELRTADGNLHELNVLTGSLNEIYIKPPVALIHGLPSDIRLDPAGRLPAGYIQGSYPIRDMNLITPSQLDALPKGTVLYAYHGRTFVVGVDEFSRETKGGFLQYGFYISPQDAVQTAGKTGLQLIGSPPAGMKLNPIGLLKRGELDDSVPPRDLNLITLEQFKTLPKGTVIYNFFGERAVVGVDDVDLQTAEGFMKYGFYLSQ